MRQILIILFLINLGFSGCKKPLKENIVKPIQKENQNFQFKDSLIKKTAKKEAEINNILNKKRIPLIVVNEEVNNNQAQYKVKYVSNAAEFINAIDNDTEIIITSTLLDFTTENLIKITGLKAQNNYQLNTIKKGYYISDGNFIFFGYKNVIIKGKENVNIISNNEYDDILSFNNCYNIVLENLSIYHTPETCNGSVVSFLFSNNIKINNCSLNGSGGVGANIIKTDNITFTSTEIFNNQFHALAAINSLNIKIIDSNIYENHDMSDELLNIICSKVEFINCAFERNEATKLFVTSTNLITDFIPKFTNCSFSENNFEYIESNKKKSTNNTTRQKYIIDTFISILVNELNSDHDNSNNELMSFFAKENIQFHANKNKIREDFIKFYNNLKWKESFNPNDDFTIKRSKRNNEFIVKIENRKWNIIFNKKNEIIGLIKIK